MVTVPGDGTRSPPPPTAGPLEADEAGGAAGLASPEDGCRGARGLISRSLGGVERAREIGHEIVLVLDADGDADERVVDAEGLARLGRDARVRHDRRVLDEALDAAERLGAGEQADGLEESARGGGPPWI